MSVRLEIADLSSMIGVRGRPRPAKFPVNRAMIGLWCDAVGDDNPAYQDDVWARGSRWGGLIAPATSLNMWTLPGYRRRHPEGEPLDVITQSLNAAGYSSVAAVNNEHAYHRPLRPGDRLAQIQYVARITGPKHTRLGEGYFFDVVSDFVTPGDELVGRAMMRILKWRPGTGSDPATDAAPAPPQQPSAGPQARSQAAGRGPLETLRRRDLRAGVTLPGWSLELSATRIIALAAATLDYNDVHFERDAAVRAGARDIYMNILGSSGLMNRYLTDWAGPETGFRAARVVLRGQNHPGDTVGYTGRVRAVDDTAAGLGPVEVEVRAANARGIHLDATVTLELPA